MRTLSCVLLGTIGVFAATAFPARVYGQHEGDLIVCRSAADQLRIATGNGGFDPFDPLGNLTVLTPVSGLFEGWSSDEPGFDAIRIDAPPDDTFALAPGADAFARRAGRHIPQQREQEEQIGRAHV